MLQRVLSCVGTQTYDTSTHLGTHIVQQRRSFIILILKRFYRVLGQHSQSQQWAHRSIDNRHTSHAMTKTTLVVRKQCE